MEGGQIVAAPGRYPRICGQCGTEFVASRRDARWCSNACRQRAWRQRRADTGFAVEEGERTRLLDRIAILERSLDRAQSTDVCADQGCRLRLVEDVESAQAVDKRRAHVTPWRQERWSDPTVRQLRDRISVQQAELARLREANGLLRRWASERVGTGRASRMGE
jgi:hypothetical protein